MLGFARSSSLFPAYVGEFLRDMDAFSLRPEAALRHFNVDMEDKGDHILVTADLPGMEPGDINVTIEKGVLAISGQRAEGNEQKGDNFYLCERCCGSFSRSFRVPDVDGENIKAELHNGVLVLSLPKKGEIKPKKVKIQTS